MTGSRAGGGSAVSSARPPRIVIVTKRLDLGGAENHILRIMPELAAGGLDMTLFVLERGGRLEPELIAQGVRIEGLETTTGRGIHAVKAAVHLARFLRRHRPQVVHYFLPEPYMIGCIVSPFAGGPVRIMSRRSLRDYQRRRPVLGRIETFLHSGTALFLANSGAVASELGSETRRPDRVGLIHNGIAVEPIAEESGGRATARQALEIGDDAIVLTIVANLIPYKGHADLLEALALASPRLAQGWRLLIVGRDDGIGAELKALADARGIGPNVLWLGVRRDTQTLLDLSDIALVASHEEGFSNSLIEAMSRAKCVIVTAVGGNLDAVVAGESGVLVPVRDPASLAAAIVALAADPGRRATLGANARDRVERHFTLEGCVSRYQNLYWGLEKLGTEPLQEIIEGPTP